MSCLPLPTGSELQELETRLGNPPGPSTAHGNLHCDAVTSSLSCSPCPLQLLPAFAWPLTAQGGPKL